jgi:hypothetical protein
MKDLHHAKIQVFEALLQGEPLLDQKMDLIPSDPLMTPLFSMMSPNRFTDEDLGNSPVVDPWPHEEPNDGDGAGYQYLGDLDGKGHGSGAGQGNPLEVEKNKLGNGIGGVPNNSILIISDDNGNTFRKFQVEWEGHPFDYSYEILY